MEQQNKEAYTQPMVVKHEPLRDITGGVYGSGYQHEPT